MSATDILYLSYDGMTDPLGQSQVIPYLSVLSRSGYRFHLVSFEKKERFQEGQDKINSILKAAGIQWYPCLYTKSPPVLSTLKDLLIMKRVAGRIIQNNTISMVHCRSYISALAGLHIKEKFNIPFLFDMRGFWADERVDGKIWSLSNPVFSLVYRYFKKKETAFLQESAHVISLTESAKQEILHWKLKDIDAGKITVIPCCADLKHFNPATLSDGITQRRRQELSIPEQSEIMIYLGSLGTWYMGEEMIRFFSFLLKEKPGMIFLVVTKDSPDKLNEWCQRYGVPKDMLRVIPAERDEVPALIAMSKLSVFFILPSYSKKASSPTKLAELMAMGVPVLCNAGVGDVADIVKRSEAGWVMSDFDDASMKAMAHKIAVASPADREKLRLAANEYGSLEIGAARYAGVYANIIGAQT